MVIDRASQQHPVALGQLPCRAGGGGGQICWGGYSCGYTQHHPAVPQADGLGRSPWEILRLTGKQPFLASFALTKPLQMWGRKRARSQWEHKSCGSPQWQDPDPFGSGTVTEREFWGGIPALSLQHAALIPGGGGAGLTWESSAPAPARCQAQINQLKTSLSIMGKAPK